jgi:hypothetical protein
METPPRNMPRSREEDIQNRSQSTPNSPAKSASPLTKAELNSLPKWVCDVYKSMILTLIGAGET